MPLSGEHDGLDTGIFIALINPGIALIFAATFLLLWHYQRGKSYILILSASFVAIAAGLLLHYFSAGFAAGKIAANLLVLAGGVGVASGMIRRYDKILHVVPMALTGIVGFAVFFWYYYTSSDMSHRIYAISFTFGALTLQVAAQLRAVENRKPIDTIMMGFTYFWGISLLVRPVLVLWIDQTPLTEETFHQSLYWVTLILSCALFMLLISPASICALVLDIMDDLKHQSQTDLLSGLLNRRGFEDSMAHELRAAGLKRVPATLILCDLDHFKAVNDTYGHAVGDEVIRCFAERLRKGAGDHVVGRVGGEEFAILLRNTDLRAARLFAEGIRTAFATAPAASLPADLRATASFGLAEWAAEENADRLFVRADQALYAAKNDGRNCVRAHGGPQPVSGWRVSGRC